jgi:hypothetical protein
VIPQEYPGTTSGTNTANFKDDKEDEDIECPHCSVVRGTLTEGSRGNVGEVGCLIDIHELEDEVICIVRENIVYWLVLLGLLA